MNAGRYLLLLLLAVLLHVHSGTELSLTEQWQALTENSPEVAHLLYRHTLWPRTLLALLLGAALALAGALLQLLTRNELVSPMTLGLSSGSWCAVVLCSLLLGENVVPPELAAFAGGALTLLLIGQLAGWHQLHGMSALIAGTALNLLLGTLAAVALMLNDQYARSLLVWGAGDLAQNDSYWLHWAWPRLLPAVMLLPLLLRPLHLLQLGPAAASSAGLARGAAGLCIAGLALWLNSVAIGAVGLISFVSLLAPNGARLLGARTPARLLLHSALAGSLLLLLADVVAMSATRQLAGVLPTSAAASLLGAPLMLALCLRQRQPSASMPLSRPPVQARRWRWPWLLLAGTGVTLFALLLSRDVNGAWLLQWPDAMLWQLRWPRAVAAMAAGAGMAVAGALLQRVLANPLASPELLGISAGASLGMLAGLVLASSLPAWISASGGALLVMLALLWLAPRYNPATLILMGTALYALLEAAVQFVLAQGSQDSFRLLNWLSGSLWHAQPQQALLLSLLVTLFTGLAVLGQRALDLLGLGDASARSAGLHLGRARLWLLAAAGGLTLVVCAQFGPLAFIGLLLPQLALQLGVRRSTPLLLSSAALGALAMAVADAASRTLLFPAQLPAGALVALVCGSVLLLLLLQGQPQKALT